MLILISGLPRAGKSSFADALESGAAGFTHVPLDKYIKEIPAGMSFLDWVDTPECVDWELLNTHIAVLKEGKPCFTPQPDWNARGRRASDGGPASGGRCMRPAGIAYVIPGCHAFRIPETNGKILKVFMETPHATIASRLTGNPSHDEPVHVTFGKHYTKNWKNVEAYSSEADFIIPGTDDRPSQIKRLLDLLAGTSW